MTDSSLSASSIVGLFDTNKEQRSSFVRQIVNGAVDGHHNILKLHKQVKAMEEIVKNILGDENYREALLSEAHKHGKSFDYLGEKWQVKEAGVKYDFSECNDPLLQDLIEEQKSIEKQIEDRCNLLKALTSSMTVVDETTGQIVTVYPPKKTSTTVVSLKMS